MSTLRVHELIYECRKRNIKLEHDKKYTSQDYLRMLGEWSLLKKYGSLDSVPFPVLYRFNLQSPMLSKLFKDIKLELQHEILTNKDNKWVAEYKYQGCRSIIVYNPNTGFHFFSRELSLETFLPVEYTDKILFVNKGKLRTPSSYANKFPKPFVLDSEIVIPEYVNSSLFHTKNNIQYNTSESNPVSSLLSIEDTQICLEIQSTSCPLSFMVFDILYYDNDLRERPFEKRKQIQEQLINKLSVYDIPFYNSIIFKNNFMTVFYDYVGKEGGEGLIFKHIDKGYMSTTGRHSDIQVKLKKDMLGSLKEQRDFDVWISGYVPPKKSSKKDKDLGKTISGISCSAYIKKPSGDELEHEICNLLKIPENIGKILTSYDDSGKAILNPDLCNKVISVLGQGITPSLKFEYSVCEEWDFHKSKNKYDCVVLEEDLMKLL